MRKKLILLTILLAAVPCSAAVITVEPDGSGDEATIQDAVDIAATDDEIVLAIGTYTGDGNRDIDFGGRSITVRSTDPNDPNTVAATIIDCQGTEEEPHRGFSFISGEDANSIVSGLTVTNGYGPVEEIVYGEISVGGAIYCDNSSPTVTHCTFSGNTADWGGGMSNYDYSNPTVNHCTFSGNTAEWGGGMDNDSYSSPTVTNCTFTGNSAIYGGGMDNYSYSSPTVTNCTFSGNTAGYDGGGMYNLYNCNSTVTNCTFTGNSARSGGGMCNYENSSPMVDSCTFSGNTAGYEGGGGMGNYYSSPTVTNCTFSGNTATFFLCGGGGMGNYYSSPTVMNCTFSDNSANSIEAPASSHDGGGGMYNSSNSSPTVTNCTFSGNSSRGMVNVYDSNPTVTNCIFTGNDDGGMYNGGSSPTVTDCTFTGNSANADASGRGGGMFNYEGSSPTVTNCTFSGNLADRGGGMENTTSSPTITNCTFSGNTATFYGGGGMCNYLSAPVVTNCILWANSAVDTGDEIYNDSSHPNFMHCDIAGSGGSGAWDSLFGTDGGGNIDADPEFVDPNGFDGVIGTEDDNLRLQSGSPCIDAGDNTAVTEPNDLDGHTRIVDGDCDGTATVDMGTYEFDWVYAGDFEGDDCDVDLRDFAVLAESFGQDDPAIDIAPYPVADGIIDFKELLILAEHWLEGTE